MENLSCAFFGKKSYNYRPYVDKLKNLIEDLIKSGVTNFYNTYQGRFDMWCAIIVHELRLQYPQINNIMVLYEPTDEVELPYYFDEAVYLQEQREKITVECVNRKIVDSVDFVVSGVVGGCKSQVACDYAKRSFKSVYNVVTDERLFWTVASPEIEEAIAKFEKRLQYNDLFRTAHEEMVRRFIQELHIDLERRKEYKSKPRTLPVWIAATIKKTTKY